MPTLPEAPLIRIVSFGRRPARFKKKSAVPPPKGSAAASSNDKNWGLCAMAPLTDMHRYSACPPIRNPLKPKTLSPTLKPFEWLPTACTTPANAAPKIGFLGPFHPRASLPKLRKPVGMSRLRIRRSPDVIVDAMTRMRRSPRLGSGRGSCTNFSALGPPYRSQINAVIWPFALVLSELIMLTAGL